MAAAATARVGWVGLGAVGAPLAGRVAAALAARGLEPLRVFRRKSIDGAVTTPTLSACADGADVMFMCLPTSTESEETAMAIARPGLIVVDATSGDPTRSAALAAALESKGTAYVDVAVSGGPGGAAAGTVSAMVGGRADDVARVRPLVQSFCGSFAHLGAAGAGHAVKAVNNTLNTLHLCAAAEGLLALKKGFGVDPREALRTINAGSGRSLQTEERLPKEVLTGRFGYGFRLGLMKKDTGIGAALLDANLAHDGALLPRVSETVAKAVDALGFDADYSEVVRFLENENGATLRSPPRAELHPDAKLLVCDMAGTTVQEDGLVVAVLRETMNETADLGVTEEDILPWRGADKTEVTRHFVERIPEHLRANAQQKINAAFVERLEAAYLAADSPVRLISADLPAYFERVRSKGVKVALNTGYPTRLQDALIKKLGLDEMVDAWTCATDVSRARPSPFMVFVLMNQLGIETGVVKAGDTMRDMQEGRAARCVQNVGVLSGADDEATLLKAGADLVLPDITHLALA